MAKSAVFVEISPETQKIIRIFKNNKDAYRYPQEIVKQSLRAYAVGEIRSQVVERATVDGIVKCEHCSRSLPGEYLGWGEKGEMNEKHAKGKLIDGKHGEVSVDNGELLCHKCHQGKDGVHNDRFWGGRKC